MSITTTTPYEELIQLSAEVWAMYQYFSNITGPYNLERAQSYPTFIYNLATKLDRAIVATLPEEEAGPTPQLRRAKAYVQKSKTRQQRA